MSNFKLFGSAVESQFKTMLSLDFSKKNMFIADVSGDELWELYLASFPEGTDPIYIENTVHDCNCCRNFVKNLGSVVFIDGSKHLTVWDTSVEGVVDDAHAVVAKAMSEFVKSKGIKSQFLTTEGAYGSGRTLQFDHFYAKVPKDYQMKDRVAFGEKATSVAVLKRSVEEISDEAVEVVLDLISQNSLYRGAEFKETVDKFLKMKKEYNKLGTGREQEFWLWTKSSLDTRFRNTVIGTLLVDLSDNVPLEAAVSSFEAKVAPTNYKRPTALVTPKMIEAAKAKVEELGVEESLYRKHAKRSDINVSDVLFADANVAPLMIGGVFDGLKATKKESKRNLDKVETVGMESFLKDILPNVNSVDLLLENSMSGNFVSLVAPEYPDAKSLFKWDNGFSWSYDGEVTDSIKERVKKAGGKVDGDIRVSVSWANGDDLDLSVKFGRQTVYFGEKKGFGCTLDVDMNAGYHKNTVDPVENIVWAKAKDFPIGEVKIVLHNFAKRSTSNVEYTVEVEILGQTYTYHSVKGLANGERIAIGSIVRTETGFSVKSNLLVQGSASFEKWGLNTGEWVGVDMVMKSPNHWGGESVGNEHTFFMLKDCKNPNSVRGFYNEFLRPDMNEHRKVFELLASNMKAEYSEDQLSGVGFSSTNKEEITLRLKGAINRIIKVKV